MATEFKRKTMADVPTTALPNTTNANSDLYTAPANCDTVIIGLLLTNKSGASCVADVVIEVQSGQGEDVYLVKGAQIPTGRAAKETSPRINTASSRQRACCNSSATLVPSGQDSRKPAELR